MKETETTVVYKKRLKWLFIAGLITGATLGTAIIKMWVK
jgi:hypothetical protein|tara:strand:- start:671 stop:787 length:117 start_codon:yes stop_codon:yes gene_type:complete